jgi:hypothetical protein
MLKKFTNEKPYNRETTINTYYEIALHKITLFTDSLNDEISNDERIKEYIDNLKFSGKSSIDNIKKLIANEYEKLCNLSNYELNKLTDTVITQNVNTRIDAICTDFNRMFYLDGLTRRFVRDNNSIVIIKVTEKINSKIWNVVEPWSQKYCVSVTYLDGVNIEDIENEFLYYPTEEIITYLTGDPIKCIVFPRTSLSKILKVINGIKIRGAIKTN